MIFDPKYLAAGEAGGKKAAVDLHEAVRNWTLSKVSRLHPTLIDLPWEVRWLRDPAQY